MGFLTKRRIAALAGVLTVGLLGLLAFLVVSPELEAMPVSRSLGALTPRGIESTAPAAPVGPRADRSLERGQVRLITGGIFYVPESFGSADGSFDLLIHLHGNTQLVAESVAQAGVNALVMVLNAGDGAGRYRDTFRVDGMCDRLVERAISEARAEGLREPKLRRLALSSWSAGYAGVAGLLSERGCPERVDAVLLLDSLHAPFVGNSRTEVDLGRVRPFVKFAREALAGKRLFALTHSRVETYHYGSVATTADALLEELGVARRRLSAADSPAEATFAAARKAMRADQRVSLRAVSEAREGEFVVQGFEGDQQSHHMAHLVQMSTTVLPALARRWGR